MSWMFSAYTGDSGRMTEWPNLSPEHEHELRRIRDRQRNEKRQSNADLYRALKEYDNG